MTRPARLLWSALLAVTLLASGGCGWHLRGAGAEVALAAVSIEGGELPLRGALQVQFERAGVAVYNGAPAVLKIRSDRWQSRVVGVDRQGRAVEQELRYQLGWQVTNRGGDALSGSQRNLVVSRSYRMSPDNALGAQDEDERMRGLIYQEAADRILRQLAALPLSDAAIEPADADTAAPRTSP